MASGTILAAAAAAAASGYAVETAGHRLVAVDRRPAALASRSAVYVLLFLLCFALCWRPLLSAAATLAALAALRLVSEGKRRLVGEPLAFSDFALLRQAVRHPDLYYVDARLLVPGVALVGLVGGWIWLEPSALPSGGGAVAAALAGLPLALAALVRIARRPAVAVARRLASPFGPDHGALARALGRDEARLGLALSLVARLLLWVERRRGPAPRSRAAPDAPLVPAPRSVVVVQIESFADPAAVPGGAPGPNLLRARRGGLVHGILGVPGHGAYTMRSEFAVLSGLDPAEIGEEGFDPYLSAGDRGFATLATALRSRGYGTTFVHPFRPGFFGRDRVMPALGFDRLLMEDAFSGAERVGGRVSDAAVARVILDEVDRAPGPALVFAATMQNHGPWTAELDPPAGAPLGRYLRHLADADRMIGALLDGLEARGAPALLCVYGDHPPILGAVGPPTDAPTTPYAVVAVGGPARCERRDLSAAGLGRLLHALAGARGPRIADPSPARRGDEP